MAKKPAATKTDPSVVKTTGESANKSTDGAAPADQPAPVAEVSPRRSNRAFGIFMALVIIGAIGAGGWASRNHWWGYVEPYVPPYVGSYVKPYIAMPDETKNDAPGDHANTAKTQQDQTTETPLEPLETTASTASIEDTAEGAEGTLNRRLDALEGQARTMEQDMASVLATLRSVQSRLQQAEDSLSSLNAASHGGNTSGNSGAAESALNFALAMGQLRDAVRSGAPYGDSLEVVTLAVASNFPDTDATVEAHMAMLQSRADTGIRTVRDLQSAFAVVSVHMIDAMSAPEEGGWLAQTLQQIRNVVRIRKTREAAEPGSPDSAVYRADDALAAGDVRAALSIVLAIISETLWESAASTVAPVFEPVLAPWIADATAHVQAEDALKALHTMAIRHMIDTGNQADQESQKAQGG